MIIVYIRMTAEIHIKRAKRYKISIIWNNNFFTGLKILVNKPRKLMILI